MEHLNNYITEAGKSSGLNLGGTFAKGSIASGIKSVVDFIKDTFKSIKEWFSKDDTTYDDLKKTLRDYKKVEDLPDELQDAIARVLKKSDLPRSDKKKKDDKKADAYDKLKAMLTIIANNINDYVISNKKLNTIVQELIDEMGSSATDVYTKILETGVAAIKNYNENAKRMYYADKIKAIVITYCVYKLTDKQGLDNERREELFKAQGTFR